MMPFLSFPYLCQPRKKTSCPKKAYTKQNVRTHSVILYYMNAKKPTITCGFSFGDPKMLAFSGKQADALPLI